LEIDHTVGSNPTGFCLYAESKKFIDFFVRNAYNPTLFCLRLEY